MRKDIVMPSPVHIKEGTGTLTLDALTEIRLGEAMDSSCAGELRSLWKGFTCRKGELALAWDRSLNPAEAELGAGAPLDLLPEDEYALAVKPSGARVRARGAVGLAHGLFTLLQLILPRGQESDMRFELPEVEIHDHPRFSVRALHLCVFPDNGLLAIEKAIRLAGVMKFTHIVLEFWGTLRYDVMPELAWPDRSFCKREARSLIELCRGLGMEVIPMFNHLGHATQSRGRYGRHVVLDQNPALAPLFEPDGWTWCLSNPQTRRLLRAVRGELMELCGPGDYFHLGCDEAYSFATCPECAAQDGARLLADYLNELTDELAAAGRRPIVWADTLLEHGAWDAATIASGTPECPTHRALPLLNRRIVMADWQYSTREPRVPSGEHLMRSGFDTLLCPWNQPQNIIALSAAAGQMNAMGVMMTTWDTLPEMMQSFGDMAECAWHGENARWSGSATSTAALLRHVMPNLPSYREAGFNPYEVSPADRWRVD